MFQMFRDALFRLIYPIKDRSCINFIYYLFVMKNTIKKRLQLIEINEFALELFERGTQELNLPNITKLLAMNSSVTTTDDQVEHRGLDPWVQWVSVHTGVPSSTHGIIHLGDTPSNLNIQQIWQVLSTHGISSGIWGAMNATREATPDCQFFLPDPWTFSEDAYPDKLNSLLSLPRYYSKNYLDVSPREFLKRTFQLIKFVMGSGSVLRLVRQLPLILRGIFENGINNAMLFSLFDLFSTILFLEQKRRSRPQFSLIFLNSIAHLQHHKWESGHKLNSDLRFGLRVIDRSLGLLFESMEDDEAVVIMNALTQRNIVGEEARICYRQINPAKFLTSVGLDFVKVEQLMTNDAHVFFKDVNDRKIAALELEKIKIFDKALFQVEIDNQNPLKLFYQIDFWDELKTDVALSINGRASKFSDHFEAIVARTGSHTRNGNIFYASIDIPEKIYNHDLIKYIYSYFSIPTNKNAHG